MLLEERDEGGEGSFPNGRWHLLDGALLEHECAHTVDMDQGVGFEAVVEVLLPRGLVDGMGQAKEDHFESTHDSPWEIPSHVLVDVRDFDGVATNLGALG